MMPTDEDTPAAKKPRTTAPQNEDEDHVEDHGQDPIPPETRARNQANLERLRREMRQRSGGDSQPVHEPEAKTSRRDDYE